MSSLVIEGRRKELHARHKPANEQTYFVNASAQRIVEPLILSDSEDSKTGVLELQPIGRHAAYEEQWTRTDQIQQERKIVLKVNRFNTKDDLSRLIQLDNNLGLVTVSATDPLFQLKLEGLRLEEYYLLRKLTIREMELMAGPEKDWWSLNDKTFWQEFKKNRRPKWLTDQMFHILMEDHRRLRQLNRAALETSLLSVLSRSFVSEMEAGLPESLKWTVPRACNFVIDSKATSTLRCYSNNFCCFRKWCLVNKLSSLPATWQTVAAYVISKAIRGLGSSSLKTGMASIAWVHGINGYKNPCNHPSLKAICEGVCRKNCGPSKKKLALTTKDLHLILEKLNLQEENLYKLRTAILILVGFVGFLRSSELISLRKADVQISGDKMRIHIRKGKTDQQKIGTDVWVSAVPESAYCPIQLTAKYFKALNLAACPEEFPIFPNLRFLNTKKRYIPQWNRSLTYGRALELFRDAVKNTSLDPANYGLHSLRSGGVTAAAEKSVPERLLKKHGRWKSTMVKDSYIQESLSTRLLVTKALPI